MVPVDVGFVTHSGFFGSPTVLVDGEEDPFPAIRTDAVSCGLYETPDGPRSSPTDAMLRTALVEGPGA